MKKHLWKALIVIGIIPLMLPVLLGAYHMLIESWAMGDWLILYSYVYWPTYVLGILLIAAGIVLRKRDKKSVRI